MPIHRFVFLFNMQITCIDIIFNLESDIITEENIYRLRQPKYVGMLSSLVQNVFLRRRTLPMWRRLLWPQPARFYLFLDLKSKVQQVFIHSVANRKWLLQEYPRIKILHEPEQEHTVTDRFFF